MDDIFLFRYPGQCFVGSLSKIASVLTNNLLQLADIESHPDLAWSAALEKRADILDPPIVRKHSRCVAGACLLQGVQKSGQKVKFEYHVLRTGMRACGGHTESLLHGHESSFHEALLGSDFLKEFLQSMEKWFLVLAAVTFRRGDVSMFDAMVKTWPAVFSDDLSGREVQVIC